MIPNGLHHITCVTVDARACVDFYTRVLGLKLVKKTINQDVPTVWHLFFGDDNASPGMDLTFFEFQGLPPVVAGSGAAHTIRWRVANEDALDFWERRLAEERVGTRRENGSLHFSDRESLGHELIIAGTDEPPLTATSNDVPEEFALRGFDGLRIHSNDPDQSAATVRNLFGLSGDGAVAEGKGPSRSAKLLFEEAPPTNHIQGAGAIHHIAWTATEGDGELEAWRLKIANAGLRPTEMIDRFWFHSVYFRTPDGLLHEFATPGPGFTVDEPLESLGSKIVLPPQFESQRAQIEAALTPLSPDA